MYLKIIFCFGCLKTKTIPRPKKTNTKKIFESFNSNKNNSFWYLFLFTEFK